MTASPDLIWLAIALIIGFILGFIPAILLARSRTEAARLTGRQELATDLAILEERLASRDSRLQQLETDIAEKDAKLDELTRLLTGLERDKSRLAAELQEQAKSADEKLQVLNDAKEELQSQFENLANRIFEAKTKSFAEQSRVYANEGKERHSLIKEVQRLQELNQKLGEDAENLTKALKGDTKAQGTWGEIILERILEESGLRKGIEYDSQGGFRDADGKLLKPDVIIHLPEEKDIIIDSKVSLVAYEKYVRAENVEERDRAVREHLVSINAHLKGLESKKYDELPGVKIHAGDRQGQRDFPQGVRPEHHDRQPVDLAGDPENDPEYLALRTSEQKCAGDSRPGRSPV
ncbi:MAG: DNA recombination protein RmuC [Desulfuromonadales bacterium]